jgi:hypothetical protein
VFNYVNLHVYHYAGNNPVKYVDPDGEADIITNNTTREEFDKLNDLSFDNYSGFGPGAWEDAFWNEAQDFFKENPDGAYYRPPGDLDWQRHEDLNDINIIDPNSAMFDLMLIFGIVSIARAGITAGLSRLSAQRIMQQKMPDVTKEAAKQADVLYRLAVSGNAPLAQTIIIKLGGTESGKTVLRNLNVAFRAAIPKASNNVELTIINGLVRVTYFWAR